MEKYKSEFIELALQVNALKFGDFTLRSGKKSPYFFNSGAFSTGTALKQLGYFYASALVNSGINYSSLFGPAYKGIPLVTAVAIALSEHFGIDVPWSFNRKETKTHGDGGEIVGSALCDRVLIIDDVITVGGAVRDAVKLIEAAGSTPCGILISLDRQEIVQQNQTATESLQVELGVPIMNIICLDELLDYLQAIPDRNYEYKSLNAYKNGAFIQQV